MEKRIFLVESFKTQHGYIQIKKIWQDLIDGYEDGNVIEDKNGTWTSMENYIDPSLNQFLNTTQTAIELSKSHVTVIWEICTLSIRE